MTSSPIPRLNETNYAEWIVGMEALLTRKQLWNMVVGDEARPLGSENSKNVKAWVRKVAEARSEIVLNIEPSQYPHVRSRDAAEVWLELERMHRARGFGTRMSRRRAFFKMALREGQAISSWIADVRRAAFALQEIGGSVDDEDIILVLTNGLPAAYEQFVITLDSTPGDKLVVEYVITRLLNEESRQTAAIITNPADAAVVAAAVAAAAGPAFDRRPRLPVEQITCFRCGVKGHYQVNCPVPSPAPSTAIPAAAPAAPAAPIAANTAYAFLAGAARAPSVVSQEEHAEW